MAVSVQQLGDGFVASVDGVDLSRPVEPADFAAVYDALLTHHVIAIRDQSLSPAAMVAASRLFGALEPHVLSQYHHPDYAEIVMVSNVVEDGRPVGIRDAGSYWHSDVSYKARPSKATLLYAYEVPAEGGDTLFVDLVAAYAALPDDTRRRIDGLEAIHSYAYRTDRQVAKYGERPPLTPEQRAEVPDVPHPVVRTHPETGAKALYVNPGFTTRIVDMAEAESAALLDELFAHSLRNRFQHRYRWRPGDLVVWDNAAVMHRATARELSPGARRTLYRTIVSGAAPF